MIDTDGLKDPARGVGRRGRQRVGPARPEATAHPRTRWAGLLFLAACATTRPAATPASFARAYDDAVEARDVELPAHVRTAADIQLVVKAHDVIAICARGKSALFTNAWFEKNATLSVTVDSQTRTIAALGNTCAEMLDTLDHREIKACGSRYVRLERGFDGKMRVGQTSEGWYMTPCDRLRTATRATRETDVVREACQSPGASVYLVAPWKWNGKVEHATMACMLPDASRTDWLPGNPGLGIR